MSILLSGYTSRSVSPQLSLITEPYFTNVLPVTELKRVDPIDYKEIFSISVSDISIINSEEHLSGITIDGNGDLYCVLRLTRFENRTNVPYSRIIRISTSDPGGIEEILKETRGTLTLQSQNDGKIRIYSRLENVSYVYEPSRRTITSQRIPFRDNQLRKLSLELVSLWPTDKTSPEDLISVSIRIQSYCPIGNHEIAIGKIRGRVSESALVVAQSASGAINFVASNPVQTNIMVSDADFPVPATSGRVPIRLPFFPVASATVWGDDRVVISTGQEDELNVYDLRGNYIERIAIGLPTPIITEDDRSSYTNEYLSRPIDEELKSSQQAILKYRYESLQLPTNKPFWRHIMGDDSGLLWLRTVTRDGTVLTLKENYRDTYIVLNPRGEMLFQTTVPPSLQFAEQQELAIPIAISVNLIARVEWDNVMARHLIKVYEILPVDAHLKDYLEQLWKFNH